MKSCCGAGEKYIPYSSRRHAQVAGLWVLLGGGLGFGLIHMAWSIWRWHMRPGRRKQLLQQQQSQPGSRSVSQTPMKGHTLATHQQQAYDEEPIPIYGFNGVSYNNPMASMPRDQEKVAAAAAAATAGGAGAAGASLAQTQEDSAAVSR